MTLPVYPGSLKYDPLVDTWSPVDLYLDPIESDFEGGNKRLRGRPGDTTRRFTFSILYSKAEYATLETFILTGLGGGISRFTMPIWYGAAFQTKTVQFAKKPVPASTPPKVTVAYDVWVFP